MIDYLTIRERTRAHADAPASPTSLRPFAWQHRQCAWCLRLKHRDGTPHGHPLPRLGYYSHGICSTCKTGLQRREVHHDTFVLVRSAQARVSDQSAA